jgi:hypothetical protein
MSLLSIIVALVVVGIVLYCINRFVPMQHTVKTLLNVVVILVLVVWILNAFGIISMLDRVEVLPRR